MRKGINGLIGVWQKRLLRTPSSLIFVPPKIPVRVEPVKREPSKPNAAIQTIKSLLTEKHLRSVISNLSNLKQLEKINFVTPKIRRNCQTLIEEWMRVPGVGIRTAACLILLNQFVPGKTFSRFQDGVAYLETQEKHVREVKDLNLATEFKRYLKDASLQKRALECKSTKALAMMPSCDLKMSMALAHLVENWMRVKRVGQVTALREIFSNNLTPNINMTRFECEIKEYYQKQEFLNQVGAMNPLVLCSVIDKGKAKRKVETEIMDR